MQPHWLRSSFGLGLLNSDMSGAADPAAGPAAGSGGPPEQVIHGPAHGPAGAAEQVSAEHNLLFAGPAARSGGPAEQVIQGPAHDHGPAAHDHDPAGCSCGVCLVGC